jgi:hypothetical protein
MTSSALADALVIVERCQAALTDYRAQRPPPVGVNVSPALRALDGLASRLRWMTSDKALVRVLEAVREGYDTSNAIARHLEANRHTVTAMLTDLYGCGAVTRLQEPQRRRGRPSYRYRIVCRA